MRHEIVFAGFGGQGVIKAALLSAVAAGLHEGKEVAQTQSYGPEARGGACRSEVVISDNAIDYIRARRIDVFAVMSQQAMDAYGETIDPEKTVVIADTTLIQSVPRQANNVYSIQATHTAEKEFGRSLYANMIMLGAVSAITGLVSLDALEKALDGNVPKKTVSQNRSALRRGYEIGKRLKRKTTHSISE